MNDFSFFRFPHTPHLAWLGEGAPRDDKVLSREEAQVLLARQVVVEEKLDGANVGISIDDAGNFRIQNRGQYLQRPFTGQFARLESWLDAKVEALFDALNPHMVVFGEWCAARHSLDYDSLPDWWMVFDVYDRTEARFWSVQRRRSWTEEYGLASVPTLAKSKFTLDGLVRMVQEHPSRYRNGPLEGIVVRSEDDDWSNSRAKLVRPDFVQSMGEHWRHRPLEWNRVAGNL
ncbi:MAG: RNA ligase family protein [Burkholderiaceae bacterium]